MATIARGYAVATDRTGRTIGTARDFAPGDAFSLRLRDGTVDAVTRAVHRGSESPEVP